MSLYFTGSQTLSVASTSGLAFPGHVTVSTSTGVAVLDCAGTTTSPSPGLTDCLYESGAGSVSTGAYVLGSANFVQGIIQEEGESLTVPEGGLSLDNVDCCWSTSGCNTTPPTAPGTTANVGVPSGSGDASCMSIAYYHGDSSYGSALTLEGWYSAATGCYVTSSGICTASYPAAGDLVQVTLVYNYTAQNPGPMFTILNSVFGLQADMVGQYSMVVTS